MTVFRTACGAAPKSPSQRPWVRPPGMDKIEFGGRSDPVAIGVKETQEIIRQAAVVSRTEPALPCKLDPQEVAMATGPRYRKRALFRPGQIPDYLRASEAHTDEWQKLDDDIYKFIQIRKDQFGRLGTPPSHQFIAE